MFGTFKVIFLLNVVCVHIILNTMIYSMCLHIIQAIGGQCITNNVMIWCNLDTVPILICHQSFHHTILFSSPRVAYLISSLFQNRRGSDSEKRTSDNRAEVAGIRPTAIKQVCYCFYAMWI